MAARGKSCLSYLDKMIEICKENNIQIILCESPSLNYSLHGTNDWMMKYAHDKGIKALDFTGDTTYIDYPVFFYDATHLNDKVAKVFISNFIDKIKPL